MMRHTIVTLAVLTISAWFCAPAWAEAVQKMATQALADKSDRMIIFFDAKGAEIGRYHAAFGQRPGSKEREGDSRTPEGDYWLSPARTSEEWSWFMPISYPNERDVARAIAKGADPKKLGGAIGLHASGDGFMRNVRQSFGENWTLGCIAVSNDAMREILGMVAMPIPIRIQP
jgi:murein L,D-transpeptidase YafK